MSERTSFDFQPTLTGERVVLRPLDRTDWEDLFAVASDPLIWTLHPAHDRHRELVFRAFFADALASGGALVVVDRESGGVIGSSRYGLDRAGPGEVEIGWTFLARAYWGGATNREVKRLMIGHALAAVDRVIFLVGETNLRSRRAMEKVGARLTVRTHEAVMLGRDVVHVIYAMDAAEFAASPLVGDEA